MSDTTEEAAEALLVPWPCDDKDCPCHWHLGAYKLLDDDWTDKEYGGPVVLFDSHNDGDYQPDPEGTLPTEAEVQAAWVEYAQWVAKEGEDPLGQWYVRKSDRRVQGWRVKVAQRLHGEVYAVAGRRPGRAYEAASTFPEALREYLELNREDRLARFFTLSELQAAVAREGRDVFQRLSGLTGVLDVTVEWEAARSRATVRRETQEAARGFLKLAAAKVQVG